MFDVELLNVRVTTDDTTVQSLRDEVADFEHVVSEAEANAGRQHIKRKRSLTSLIIVCDASSSSTSLSTTRWQDFAFLLRYKWRSSTQASPGA